MLNVVAIPALHDNYIWTIVHQQQAIIVDPGEAQPILHYLKKNQLELIAILITHHHHDHSDGTAQIKQHHPNALVYGPIDERIATLVDRPVKEADRIDFDQIPLALEVLEVPAHTKSHIAYVGGGMLFCGDTLFSAGCGRLFEGSAEQMYRALQRFACLPLDTKVYPGHEYTLSNLRFAHLVEPDNAAIIDYQKRTIERIQDSGCSLPSTIGLEREVNPFLRCHLPAVQASASKACSSAPLNPIAVLACLREWKNRQ